jgi:hypothetical protein
LGLEPDIDFSQPGILNPQFQHGLQGMPGSQLEGTPKNASARV